MNGLYLTAPGKAMAGFSAEASLETMLQKTMPCRKSCLCLVGAVVFQGEL